MRIWGVASAADVVRVGPPGAPGSRLIPLGAGLDPDTAVGRAGDSAIDFGRCLVWVRGADGWGAPTALAGAVVEAMQSAINAAAAAATRAEAAEATVQALQVQISTAFAAVVADRVVATLAAPNAALVAALQTAMTAALADLPVDLPTTENKLWLAGRSLALS